MDFSTLLSIAEDNKNNKDEGRKFVSTAVSAAKKDPKQRQLSSNIQKFLQKREDDDMTKKREALVKKKQLLDLRSHNKKSQRVANSMIKMTKSSNKSVVQEAVNSRDTEATLAGRNQCDQDDYGYESTAANSIYEKLMSKYEKNPEDPMAKFAPKRKTVGPNMAKVNKAVEAIKPCQPFRRPQGGPPEQKKEEGTKKKKTAGPLPPSFSELLQMAQKKQGTPVEEKLKKEVREAEFNRPMTAKEKEEFIRERNSQLRKAGKLPPSSSEVAKKPEKVNKSDEKGPKIVSPSTPPPPPPPPQVVMKNGKLVQPSQKKMPEKRDIGSVESRPFPAEIRPPKKKPKMEPPPRKKEVVHGPSSSPVRRPNHVNKNRIESDDDDDDDDYDSADDFIDDTDAGVDISAEIRNIFGYDRRKFRHEADFDDRSMENNRFADVMKEEARSARIGRMEDLEDMRREEEEKKRKKSAKKKRR